MPAAERRIVYRPREDVTPEAEADALATVYQFVLDCKAKKEAAGRGRPNDAKEIESVRARSSIRQR